MIVEDTGDAVLFEIDLARHGIEAHLVGLEEGAEVVIIDLIDGIVFVVVALRAVQRQPEEGLAGVLDRVVEPRGAVEEVVVSREESGRADRLGVAGCEFVGGEHLGDHAIVGPVLVERLDDPIAPVPEVFLAVAELVAESIPIGVAPHVHPVPRPALAVLGTGEQLLDDRFVRLRVAELLCGRRQTDEIEVETAEEEASLSCGSGNDLFLTVFFGEKSVDRMTDPRYLRHGGTLDAAEGPMIARIRLALLIGRHGSPGENPGADRGDLLRLQRSGVEGHAFVDILRGEPIEEPALVRFPRDDDRSVRPSVDEARCGVEPQAGLLLQGAVAGLATLRQHGLDLAEIIDRFTRGNEAARRQNKRCCEDTLLIRGSHPFLSKSGRHRILPKRRGGGHPLFSRDRAIAAKGAIDRFRPGKKRAKIKQHGIV